MVAATFYLGMAYYYEGNFKKAKEIIEPSFYNIKVCRLLEN